MAAFYVLPVIAAWAGYFALTAIFSGPIFGTLALMGATSITAVCIFLILIVGGGER